MQRTKARGNLLLLSSDLDPVTPVVARPVDPLQLKVCVCARARACVCVRVCKAAHSETQINSMHTLPRAKKLGRAGMWKVYTLLALNC